MAPVMTEGQRELAERNLKLVGYMLARMNLSRDEDAYGAGCLGLCRAAALWHEGGCAFSTFACHMIRHEILDSLSARGAAGKSGALTLQDVENLLFCTEEGYRRAEDRDLLARILGGRAEILNADELAAVRLLAAGRSVRKAAAALGVSPATVSLLRKSAAKKIKSAMGGEI